MNSEKKIELLSPAGNVEKLFYAYAYGADAAYIGLKKFSLRIKADNFYGDEYKKVIELKQKYPEKRLHCALNISFHDEEIDNLKQNIDYFKSYPIDAFIVQDLGIVPLLQKEFPDAELHLSTQASCVNSESVKIYKSLGFKRIVLGREISLEQIKRIKDSVPEMEIETFVHGAMCIAYAGRCLMSAYLTGRSAQSGFCSHACRWEYDVLSEKNAAKKLAESGNLYLREHQRPDELFPVFEGEDFTAILSSKDLCMINHLDELKAAGVDSLKIEGRMKSVYYVALVTRAYRKALDAIEGKISKEKAEPFVLELENVSHRESTTGFYYDKSEADKTTTGASDSRYELAAEIVKEIKKNDFEKIFSEGQKNEREFLKKMNELHPKAKEARLKDIAKNPDKNVIAFTKKKGWKMYECKALNMIKSDSQIEFVFPEIVCIKAFPGDFELINPETGTILRWVCDGHPCVIYTKYELSESSLIRIEDKNYEEGKIRDTGR